MSQHILEDSKHKFVFGWDQPLQSFFLQVHHKNLPEDSNPVVMLGTAGKVIYEVEDLAKITQTYGLDIDIITQSQLFVEKDQGI